MEKKATRRTSLIKSLAFGNSSSKTSPGNLSKNLPNNFNPSANDLALVGSTTLPAVGEEDKERWDSKLVLRSPKPYKGSSWLQNISPTASMAAMVCFFFDGEEID